MTCGNVASMPLQRPVSVEPPDRAGGQLVRIHGQPVGRAFGLWDMIVYLDRAGLDLGDEDDIAASELVEWIGAAPRPHPQAHPHAYVGKGGRRAVRRCA